MLSSSIQPKDQCFQASVGCCTQGGLRHHEQRLHTSHVILQHNTRHHQPRHTAPHLSTWHHTIACCPCSRQLAMLGPMRPQPTKIWRRKFVKVRGAADSGILLRSACVFSFLQSTLACTACLWAELLDAYIALCIWQHLRDKPEQSTYYNAEM